MKKEEKKDNCNIANKSKKEGYDGKISSQEYPFYLRTLCDMVANGKISEEALKNNQQQEKPSM